MKKLTMLASVAVVALSASAFAAAVEHKTEAKHGHKHHDYKAVKEVKTDVVAVAADVSPASKQGVYVVAGAGYGKFSVKTDNADDSKLFAKKSKPTFMVGLGYQFDNQFRLDLTADTSSKLSKTTPGETTVTDFGFVKITKETPEITVSYKLQTVMLNGYYHFNEVASVSPYVTGGIGYAQQKIDLKEVYSNEVQNEKLKTHHVGYQVGFGFSKAMSDNVTLDLGYKYFATKKVTLKGYSYKIHPKAHKVMASVRYAF